MNKHSFESVITEQQALDLTQAYKSYEVMQELAFTLLTCSSNELEQIFISRPEKLHKVIKNPTQYLDRSENIRRLTIEALNNALLVLDNLELEGKA